MPLGMFPEENAQALDTLYRGSPMGPPQPHWYSGVGTGIASGLGEAGMKTLEPLAPTFAAASGNELLGALDPTGQYDEPPKPISPQFREDPRAAASKLTQQFAPDPATTGWLGQTLHQVTSVGGRFVAGTAVGGPLAGAALAGGTEAYSGYQKALGEGIDDSTAKKLAAADFLMAGPAALIPFGIGGSTAAKLATGALTNIGVGAGSRALTHTILDDAGYHTQADQYKVLDGQSLASDTILGMAFGWLARNHDPVNVPQATVDAAHAMEDNAHLETGLFGDIPVNGQSRNDHIQNVIDATHAELNGEPVPAMRPVETIPNPEQEAIQEAGAKGLDSAAKEAESEVAGPRIEPITAFHGSPHEFDEFNSQFIGTGEGAQAYGHGLYFASQKDIADHYKYALSQKGYDKGATEALQQFKSEHPQQYNDFNEEMFNVAGRRLAPEELATELQNVLFRDKTGVPQKSDDTELMNHIIANVKQAPSPVGHAYEVQLAPKQKELLDWDKPLGEQSKFVRDRLQQMEDRINSTGGPKVKLTESMTGEQVASLLGVKDKGVSRVAASKFLESIGVRGISYLDRTSRSKGEGTKNFVIFNDKDVQITKKNEVPVSRLSRSFRAEEAQKAETATAAEDPELSEALAQVRDVIARNPDKVFPHPETGEAVEPQAAMTEALQGMKDAEGEGKLGEVAAACFGRG